MSEVLKHKIYKSVQESICDWMINDVQIIAKYRKKNARVLVNLITKNVVKIVNAMSENRGEK